MSQIEPMPKEVCCRNFNMLFAYLERAQGLPGGLAGHDVVVKVLEGLVGNPGFRVWEPKKRGQSSVVQEIHLRNKRYWVSQAYAYKIFNNAATIIGGYRPLYHAGLYSAYLWAESIQPRHFQILRFVTLRLLYQLNGFFACRFNNLGGHRPIVFRKGYAETGRRYDKQYAANLTKDVCDWNAGIYAGVATYISAFDVEVVEKACVIDGDPECVFAFRWRHPGFFRKLFIFFHSVFDPDYVKERDLDNLLLHDLVMRQDGIIAEKIAAQSEAQDQLARTSRRLLEQRITGGFAHEMRNAVAGAQLEIQSLCDYSNEKKSAPQVLRRVAVDLMRELDRLHRRNSVSREELGRRWVPGIKRIAAIADDLNEAVSGVEKDLRRSMDITTQIRDYAKIAEVRAGKDPIDLALVLKDLQAKHRKANELIQFSLQVENDGPVIVRGDEAHMNSIFNNLIQNAREALEEKSGPNRKISVTLRRENHAPTSRIVVNVSDNGPGIPPSHLDEIFEPFFTTKQPTGTGLGLGFVQRLVHLYDGDITVNSTVGHGAVARVEIPIVDEIHNSP